MTATAHSLAGPAHAPVWCGRELTWLDPVAERLHVARLTEGAPRPVAAYALDARPLSALPTRTGWLVSTTTGTHHLRRDGRTEPTPWPSATLLACDPGARLWLSTPTALLRTDSSGVPHVVAAGPTLALAWHPAAHTLYRATPSGIHAHPYDLPNGTLGPPTRLATTPTSSLAMDATGHLWVADTNCRPARLTSALAVEVTGHPGMADASGAHRPSSPATTDPTGHTLRSPSPTGCCFTPDRLLLATPTGIHVHDVGIGGTPTLRPTYPPQPPDDLTICSHHPDRPR